MMIETILALIAIVSQNEYCMYSDCGESLRYNCQDFTRDAVLILRANGYDAYPAFGYLNHKAHSWVVIYIGGNQIHIEPAENMVIYPTTMEDYDSYNPYFFRRTGVARGLV